MLPQPLRGEHLVGKLDALRYSRIEDRAIGRCMFADQSHHLSQNIVRFRRNDQDSIDRREQTGKRFINSAARIDSRKS